MRHEHYSYNAGVMIPPWHSDDVGGGDSIKADPVVTFHFPILSWGAYVMSIGPLFS